MNCFFNGFPASFSAGYSGSITATTTYNSTAGTMTNCYYLADSALDEQSGGSPLVKGSSQQNATAAEFDTEGNLTEGSGTLLAALDSGGTHFKAGSDMSGGAYPVLNWETAYKHEVIDPPPAIPSDETALTITSPDGLFADVELTISQLKEHSYVPYNTDPYITPYERTSGQGTFAYSNMEGIKLTDLLTYFVPYQSCVTEVKFKNSDSSFTTNNFLTEASAMLLWKLIDNTTMEDRAGGGLATAVKTGGGKLWGTDIKFMTVTMPKSTVTFNLSATPGASVQVRDANNKVLTETSPGVYDLATTGTYEYTVSATGYVSKVSSVTPTTATEAVFVPALTSTGGGPGGSGTSYTVTGYTGTHGKRGREFRERRGDK